MLDGLNNADSMSVVKLDVVDASEFPYADHDDRFRVTLKLEFFHEVDARAFKPRPVGALRISSDKIWHTTVYVQDKVEFSKFVAWKSEDTQKQWDRYAAVLEGM